MPNKNVENDPAEPVVHKKSAAKGMLQSLGLVFGDIGTSPIYTLTVIFLLTKRTEANIIGVLSLIFWTLVLLVTVQYAWLAMSLGKRGEGGTIVLKEILVPLLKTGRQVAFITLLTYIGVSLIIGDGVITPAISILSAVEGILLIPGFEGTERGVLILVAGIIAGVLFSFQKKGTEKVAGAFGPIMLLWFLALSVAGIAAMAQAPGVARAVNPWYAVRFFLDNGVAGFFVLSEVILCATGGEALYADMGHLGREPIVRAWSAVFIALVLNYFGQGAFIVTHPEAKNVLFEMVFTQARFLYIPFLVLSIAATVIASQAMISGMFSIVYQGIMTRIMPIFKVEYTSTERQSQIYIGFVNWSLLAAVLFIMVEFRESSRLAAAYGLAVTGTMTITGIMMTWIFLRRKKYLITAAAALVTLVSATYLLSNTYKIPHGGYWSLLIAAVPFGVSLLYIKGQRRLYEALRPLPIETFLLGYNQIYRSVNKIRGTALYFAKDAKEIPPYIVHTMFKNHIVYEENIIVSIVRRVDPFGASGYFREDLAPGLRVFEIQSGYMEVIDVEEILREAGISEKTIFYGVEDIMAGNVIWKAFSAMKKLTPNLLQFYKLPPNKLHGVVTRVEM
jgi:KUP system potassium uptake protein